MENAYLVRFIFLGSKMRTMILVICAAIFWMVGCTGTPERGGSNKASYKMEEKQSQENQDDDSISYY